MGRWFRFTWMFTIERDRQSDENFDPSRSSAWLKWIAVGLASLGIASVVLWKLVLQG